MTRISGDVTLRPVRSGDEPFLRRLYASTRADEMALLAWSEDQKASFLEMQFTAQHSYYQRQFPEARFDIVEEDGRPVGRLYVDRRPEEIRLIDIALLPEHRNRGIGGRLMDQLLAEARTAGKPVTIHVERFNPALRLYRRLGFREVEDKGVYLLLAWSPG